MFIFDKSSSECLHAQGDQVQYRAVEGFPQTIPPALSAHISCLPPLKIPDKKSSKKSLNMNAERQREQGRSCTWIHWMQTVTDQPALTVVKIGTNVTLAPTWLETGVISRPHFLISTDGLLDRLSRNKHPRVFFFNYLTEFSFRSMYRNTDHRRGECGERS